jgi:hypothetical protein
MTNDKKISGPLPGMAAVALWMILLCGIGVYGVIRHQLPSVVLVLCAFFAAASSGLLRQRRWGWALSLAALSPVSADRYDPGQPGFLPLPRPSAGDRTAAIERAACRC